MGSHFRRPLVALSFIPLISWACGGEPAATTTDPRGSLDSAGVRIVWSAAPERTGAGGWTLAPEPALTIGEVEGEEPYLFQAIGDVAELPDGRIALVEEGTNTVRVFGRDGRHHVTVGGEGDGPGEFARTPSLAVAPDGRILAWDGRSRRVTWYEARGGVTREWRAAAPLNELGVASQRALLLPDGSIVLGDREPVEGPNGVTVMVWEPVLLAPDAAPADARPIGTFPDDRTWRTRGPDGVGRTLRAPFGHAIWTAASPDGAFFLTPKPAWEVLRYGSDGRLASVIRAAVPSARIPDDSLEARARGAAEATRLPLAEIRAAFERLGPLDSLPAIGGILAAPDRHLWVERYNAGTGGPAVHDVIDAEGRWVTTVRIPRAVGELAHVGRDRVYLRWKDELEVPYLRVHELLRGG